MRLLLALLALLLLTSTTHAQPAYDAPGPAFLVSYPPESDVTIRVEWRDASQADRRWLASSRKGAIIAFGPAYYDTEHFLIYLDLDDWRNGDTFTYCRQHTGGLHRPPIIPPVQRCFTSQPWLANSVYLPLTRSAP